MAIVRGNVTKNYFDLKKIIQIKMMMPDAHKCSELTLRLTFEKLPFTGDSK